MLTCRNALMYFNSETQARVLDRFSFALRDHGLLMLGKAEMLLTQGQLFRPVDLGHRLFRKAVDHGRRRALVSGGAVEVPQGDIGLRRVAQAAFISAPEAQLVLDRDGVLSMVNDSAVRNLGVRREDVGSPIQDLPLSYQPVELRGPVAAVHDGGEAVSLKNVPWRRGDQDVWYDVQVVPLSDDGVEVLGVQITFLDVTRYQLMARDLEAAHRDLETAYEELQSSNEELETTNEELQSAVEELETTNEELQSTNEELETMNEELQSTNEELQTLNDELRERTGEVNQVNTFLESILTGLRGGVVVVDDDLVIRVWNERAERMWGLRAHEAQGQHFLNLDIGLPVASLRSTLKSILSGEKSQVELTVDATNRFGKPVTCTHQLHAAGLPDRPGQRRDRGDGGARPGGLGPASGRAPAPPYCEPDHPLHRRCVMTTTAPAAASAQGTGEVQDAGHVDVLIVGAGVSGIGAAHHLQERFPDRSFVILDAQDHRGGTWWTHRYPGVRSDSDLFTYGYRFKPWRGPSIAAGEEILDLPRRGHRARTTSSRHIRYRHRVTAASWSIADRRWTVEVTRERHRRAAALHHRLPVDVPGLLRPRQALPAAVGGHGPVPGPGRAPAAVARGPRPHRQARRRHRLRSDGGDADPGDRPDRRRT